MSANSFLDWAATSTGNTLILMGLGCLIITVVLFAVLPKWK